MLMVIKNINITFFKSMISKERNNENQASKNKSGRKAVWNNCCSCALLHSSISKGCWVFATYEVVLASPEGRQFLFALNLFKTSKYPIQ